MIARKDHGAFVYPKIIRETRFDLGIIVSVGVIQNLGLAIFAPDPYTQSMVDHSYKTS